MTKFNIGDRVRVNLTVGQKWAKGLEGTVLSAHYRPDAFAVRSSYYYLIDSDVNKYGIWECNLERAPEEDYVIYPIEVKYDPEALWEEYKEEAIQAGHQRRGLRKREFINGFRIANGEKPEL